MSARGVTKIQPYVFPRDYYSKWRSRGARRTKEPSDSRRSNRVIYSPLFARVSKMSTLLSRLWWSIKTSAFSRAQISASFVMPRTRKPNTRRERALAAAQAAPYRLIKISLCRADKADPLVSANLRSRYPVVLVKARPSSSSRSETMNFPTHKTIRQTRGRIYLNNERIIILIYYRICHNVAIDDTYMFVYV